MLPDNPSDMPDHPSEQEQDPIHADQPLLADQHDSALAAAQIDIGTDDDPEDIFEELVPSYFEAFTEKEIKAFEKQYNKNRVELNDLIEQYKWSYIFYEYQYHFFRTKCINYFLFLVATSTEGMNSLVHVADSDFDLPTFVSYCIGIPLAILDLIFNVYTFSSVKEAVKSTLEYATRDSYLTRFRNYKKSFTEAPLATLTTTAVDIGDQTLILTHNLNGTFSEILPLYQFIPLLNIPPIIDMLPIPANLAVIGLLFWGGDGYYRRYVNEDYFAGKKFWFESNLPSLLTLIRRGQLAIPAQIFLQGIISTVLIRSFPNHYYLAVAAYEKFDGLWPPALLIAILVGFHSLIVRYPTSYKRYVEDQEFNKNFLREQLHHRVQRDIDELMRMPHLKLDAALADQNKKQLYNIYMEQLVTLQMEQLIAQTKRKEGTDYLTKNEPLIFPFLIYRLCVCAGFSYAAMAPILLSLVGDSLPLRVTMYIMGILPITALGVAQLYKAEDTRVTHKLIRAHLESPDEAEKKIEKTSTNKTDLLADSITVSSQMARMMSTVGSGSLILGNKPAAISIIATVAFELMINSILFSYKKVRETFSKNNTPRTSTHRAALFHHSPKPDEDEKEEKEQDSNELTIDPEDESDEESTRSFWCWKKK